MSIGNLKDTGNQGNNLPFQWKVLQGLQEIANQTAQPLTCVEDSVTICNDNIDALTFTGNALNVNIASGVTLEVNLDALNDQVGIYGYVDGAAGSPVPLNTNASGQVAIQDGGNSITVDGSVSVTGEVEIINAVGSPIPVTVVAPVPVINVNLDAVDDQVGVYGYVNGASTTPVPLNVNASGVVAIQDNGGSITVDSNPVVRTPTFLRPTGVSGTVAAGTFSMSFASVGTADATVGGITLKPGETLNFDAGAINNTLGAVSYSTLTAGAELIIITLT